MEAQAQGIVHHAGDLLCEQGVGIEVLVLDTFVGVLAAFGKYN